MPFSFSNAGLGMLNIIITASRAGAWEAELKIHIKNQKDRAVSVSNEPFLIFALNFLFLIFDI